MAVTLTENVQALFAAIVPFDKVTELEVVLIVPEPHEPVSPLGVATASPAGMVSMKATPLSALPGLGFEMVKLKGVEPPRPMEALPKDFEIEGAEPTVKLAEAVAPVPPLVDVMEPVVLVYEPGVELVTVTLNVQELAAEIEPPDKVIAPEPAVAVTVPEAAVQANPAAALPPVKVATDSALEAEQPPPMGRVPAVHAALATGEDLRQVVHAQGVECAEDDRDRERRFHEWQRDPGEALPCRGSVDLGRLVQVGPDALQAGEDQQRDERRGLPDVSDDDREPGRPLG